MANINKNEIGYNENTTANALMVQYKRGLAAPMDISEVFTSLNSAQQYAEKDPIAYAGQTIAVAGEGIKTEVYKITSGGTLVRLVDENDIKNLSGGTNNITVATPNWNAQEGEEGYIENRTHYRILPDFIPLVYTNQYIETYNTGDEIYSYGYKIKLRPGYYVYTHYWDYIGEPNSKNFTDLSVDLYTRIKYFEWGGWPDEMPDGEDWFDAPCLIVETEFDNINDCFDYLNQEFLFSEEYIHYKQLDEKYIPNTIARKSELTELSAQVGKKVDADKVAKINGKSLINGGDITIEGGSSVTPDWNTQEGEAGYIKNKPFGFEDYTSEDITVENLSGDFEREILTYSEKDGFWGSYDYLGDNPLVVLTRNGITIAEMELALNTNKQSGNGEFSLKLENNVLYIQGWSDTESETFKYYIGVPKQLNEVYIPDTIARKSDIATINGISIVDGGDIEIEGGSGSSPFVKGDVENSAVLKGEYEGYSNKAISQVSTAIGAASTSGLKGWYYTHVDVNNKKIYLSDKQYSFTILGKTIGCISNKGASVNTSFNSGYEIGDVLSIVYDSKYEDYATITYINGNEITLDKVPFKSEDFNSLGVNVDTSKISNLVVLPDDYSVYCIKRDFNDTTKVLTLSKYDKGGVDFGGGTLSEGVQTYAVNIGAHAEGAQTVAKGQFSHAEGLRTQSNYAAHAEGINSIAYGYGSHAEGSGSIANGESSHAEGYKTQAIGKYSHTEGRESVASGVNSHAEGQASYANKNNSHAEGQKTTADGDASHSEGRETIASGNYSHAEGRETTASNNNAHAEGQGTVASGHTSHAEGWKCIAGTSDTAPTANSNEDLGNYAHAEGNGTWAKGNSSHAEGKGTKAFGLASHAEGVYTVANNQAEHAEGKYNVSTKSDNASQATHFSIGIGTSNTNRKNAVEVKQNGDVYITGIGGFDGVNYDTAKSVQDTIKELTETVKKLNDIITQITINE